jgi:MFS family permease
MIITLPLAWLGDKWGSKTLIYLGAVGSIVVFVPLVLVIQGHQVAMIYLLASLLRITLSGAWAPLSTLMAQMFRPQARYTSMSLSYGIGAAVWGGLSPVIATALIAATGSFWSAVVFFGVLCVLAVFGAYFAPQHSDNAPVTESLIARGTTAIPTTSKD